MLTYASGELPPRRVFREPSDGREDQHLQRLTSPTRHRHSRTYDSYGAAYRYVGPLRRAQGVSPSSLRPHALVALHTDMSGHFVALKVSVCAVTEGEPRTRVLCGGGGKRESMRDCVCATDTHNMTYSYLFHLVFVDT